jgi:hypothetical protein
MVSGVLCEVRHHGDADGVLTCQSYPTSTVVAVDFDA